MSSLDGSSFLPVLFFGLNDKRFWWLAGCQVRKSCLSWDLWEFGYLDPAYHPVLTGVGFTCCSEVCSSNWCEMCLCLWSLFFQLLKVFYVLVIPTGVGCTCAYRVGWCCWRELFKGRLLFFQLVQVVFVPLGSILSIDGGDACAFRGSSFSSWCRWYLYL